MEPIQKTFEAVHENGVLGPLTRSALADSQRVQLTIVGMDTDIAAYFEADEWEASKRGAIGLDQVRVALSSIQRSLSDAVIAFARGTILARAEIVSGYFLDTSAFAKLYHQEAGSDFVERIAALPKSCVISRLSLIEIESAVFPATKTRGNFSRECVVHV